MLIMVFDVPAEYGGALSVLNEYYEKAKLSTDNWIFVVSIPKLFETTNVKIMNYPWVKKSWLHRLFFEIVISPKIVRNFSPNLIISLQNTLILNEQRVQQTIYLHQSLPFIEHRFKLLQDPKLWIYQVIIGTLIKCSLKKADNIIVQTEWMKNACIDILKLSSEKVIIEKPCCEITVNKFYCADNNNKFFYPAGILKYKNHEIIIKACIILKKKGIVDYEIIFTANPNDNSLSKRLYKLCQEYDLPIRFIGYISKDLVFNYYCNSILIFPSYVESSPLPLSEAKAHHTFILASSCSFSKEILSSYNKVKYFNWNDSLMLSNLIENIVTKK